MKWQKIKPSTVVLNGIPCKYCWVCLYSDNFGQVLGWWAFRWKFAIDSSANSSISYHIFLNTTSKTCAFQLQALDEMAFQSLQNPKGPTNWELTTSHRKLRDKNKTICKESTDADSHELFLLVSSDSLPNIQGFLRQWNIRFKWYNWAIQRNQRILLVCRHLSKVKKLKEKDGQNQQTQASILN